MSDDEHPPSPTDSVAVDDQAAAEREAAFPVVGVGASAGGLEALTLLLRALPTDTGMGFVIVQHLAPDHESSLAEILSRTTKMKVREVRDEPTVEPDRVYVIPPGRDMVIVGGKLRLLPQERRARHRGIDQFFRSLAADCGHKAIGVVLSGGASDGTLGLEEIKAEGGITFAQDDSAQHDSMPRSAVASGCVDFVLSPEKIASEIARIARHPYVAPEPEAEAAEESDHARIAQIIQRATGVDFTYYKANTLQRRIKRRMLLHKHDTLQLYETHLAEVPEEVEALFQDILISVTSFFRDPAAFDALARTVFPKLLTGRSRSEPLRIWTLGCSTGEEAYSLAMTFTECAETAGSDVPLQLFATDLNHTGVGKARTGLYAKSIAQDVSPERLRRFFTEEDGGFRICKAIRDRCIFSRHNVLADPPFSRVDLISCRNLLIYLEPVLQQQIVPLLHYALKPGGFLWLGSSETAGTSRALFEVEDARNKIYVRRPGAGPPGTRFRPWAGGALAEPFPRPAAGPRGSGEAPRADLPKEAERVLLTRYAPPGVVISAAMDIMQFRGDTGAYLAPAAGAPSLHLLKMLREGLLVSVRAAILRAGEEGRTVRTEGLRVKCDGGFRDVAVEVVPIESGATKESGFLVLFDEGERPPPDQPEPIPNSEAKIQHSDEVPRLMRELTATREYLQSVIEQQEAANEELQSANEEAQSSNEELATVNEELNNRSQELTRLNEALQLSRDYAESIVDSVRWPLVVLDAGLRVKTASRAFYEVFRVAPEKTEGRLIYDLGNGQWNIPALRTLLEELLPREDRMDDFEVRHSFEHLGARIMLFNARRLPPRAEHEPLMVLAIEDITERTEHQAALRRGELRYRRLFESARDGVLIIDPTTWRILDANPSMTELLACTREELLGKELFEIGLIDDEAASRAAFRELKEAGFIRYENLPLETKAGARREVEFVSNIYQEDGMEVIQCNIRDITERKQAEASLLESVAFNRSIFESSPDCIKVLDLDGHLLSMESGQALLGIEDIAPFLNKSWIDLWEDEHRLAARAAVESAVATGEGKFGGFFRTLRGEDKWWDVAISPIRDASGETVRLLAVSRDVTERHELEDSLIARAEDLARADRSKDEFLAMLAHELRNPLAPMRNSAEILQTADAGAEACALAQGILNRQIENMSRMIDDLLDVSRITEGKIELHAQVVALADVVNAAASLARPGIEARGQELTITLPPEPIFLNADATRLDQVFGNLLNNACKYSASGCHISISAERSASLGKGSSEVIVRVRDDGMGIAPELLPRIFDLFVQATRSLDRTHGGLGIGLTLVRRLVKLHGGSVEAHSAGLDHGSEFIVRLPILPSPVPAPPPPSARPAREASRRMLIVDDHEDSVASMATLQRLRGHEVRTASTGPGAVIAAAEFLPEVVLLDIGLPGMDGFEVARQLRAMPALAQSFLVAMSGYGSPADLAQARAAGFDEYLVKPADLTLLREWLRRRD